MGITILTVVTPSSESTSMLPPSCWTLDQILAIPTPGVASRGIPFPASLTLLTRQMRDVSHDRHLIVVYSRAALPDRPPGPTPESLARYRKAMEQSNCMFERVEILSHKVGYLRLNSFFDPSICQATAAMASLNHVDAIVFDLRANGGGYPSMVMLIAAYLFDHPECMYNPREIPRAVLDAVACSRKTGGQAGICVDLSQDSFRRGAIQLQLEDAETRHACG